MPAFQNLPQNKLTTLKDVAISQKSNGQMRDHSWLAAPKEAVYLTFMQAIECPQPEHIRKIFH